MTLADRIAALRARAESGAPAIAIVLTLALSAAITLSAWDFARAAAATEARLRFEFRARQITEAIRGRMVDYEQVLRGGVGLFAVSAKVERADWRAFVGQLRIETIYPGILSIGYMPRVPAEGREQHEQAVRAGGFAGYAIRPPGERAEYAPVEFIEPFNDRNLRAFGYDMLSEAERRATAERARDSGEPALSGRLKLVQETDRDVQAGFIMYLPVYRGDMDIETVARRGAALRGFVFASFRADDLMRGILGELDDVRLRVVDDMPGDDDKLLYDSLHGVPGKLAPAYAFSTGLPMRGRTWSLQMESLPAFEQTVDRRTPLLVAAASAVLSVLLLGIIWSLATLRARAARLARQMTVEVRRGSEQLELALQGSNLALFDWNVPTGEVVLSEQWADILGGEPVPTRTTIAELQALMHPDDAAAVLEKVRSLLRGQIGYYEAEHRVRARDGEWKWVLSRAKVAEREAGGRAVRVTGTNADVTERKEVERLKNEFTATVSHELRTPLTAIIGALGLLKELAAGKLEPETAQFLAMAQQNSERLAALINDILDIEKFESGRMEFRREPVAIAPLLERAATLNAPYAEKFGVRYELARPAADAVVSGDEDRLLQVMTNLMSNAAKFSPPGAAVTVSAALRDGRVRVAVADRGPGVPEAFRDRIFGKFAQADGSDTRGKGGTGLGLAISRAIIEQMGGTMGFDSVAGRGATFWFELPLQS